MWVLYPGRIGIGILIRVTERITVTNMSFIGAGKLFQLVRHHITSRDQSVNVIDQANQNQNKMENT